MNNFFLFLIIKNAQISKKKFIFIENNNNNKVILNFLWNNGYIFCYNINKNKIKIYFKYLNTIPVIKTLKIISKSSRKIYLSLKQLYKLNSNKFFVVFTNHGLKSVYDCKHKKIGGKLILVIN